MVDVGTHVLLATIVGVTVATGVPAVATGCARSAGARSSAMGIAAGYTARVAIAGGIEWGLATGRTAGVTIAIVRLATAHLTAASIADARRVSIHARRGAVAAVSRVRGEVRLAAVRGVAVAIAESGVANDIAGASRAAGGAVRGTADSAAAAAVIDVVGRVRLTTIGDVAVAVSVAGTAIDATNTIAARRRAVGAIADRRATAAVSRIRLQVYFATVRDVVVAVRVPRVTGNATRAGRAARGAIVGGAGIVAGAAIRRGIQFGFAAIGDVVVAIGIAAVARDAARAVAARGRSIVGRAFGAARVAVVDVRLEVDLTTIARHAVTIIVSRIAALNAANTRGALGRGVGQIAFGPTIAAIVDIRAEDVGLTDGGSIAVAFGKTGRARAVAAGGVGAHGRPAGASRTLGATGAAVVDVRVEVDLATVCQARVAVAKAVVTGNAAGARGAGRGSVRAVAHGRAVAAVLGIAVGIHFAAVGRTTVTIGITRVAGLDCADPAIAGGCRVRQVA